MSTLSSFTILLLYYLKIHIISKNMKDCFDSLQKVNVSASEKFSSEFKAFLIQNKKMVLRMLAYNLECKALHLKLPCLCHNVHTDQS